METQEEASISMMTAKLFFVGQTIIVLKWYLKVSAVILLRTPQCVANSSKTFPG